MTLLRVDSAVRAMTLTCLLVCNKLEVSSSHAC